MPVEEVVAWASTARTTGSGGVPVLARGAGRAATAEVAVARALAEALERYAAAFWDHSDQTTLRGSGTDALVMAHLVDVPAKAVPVPAEQVFLPYTPSAAPQESAGLACAPDIRQAVVGAVAERIERQVFWAAVEGSTTPVRVEPDGAVHRITWSADLDHRLVCLVRTATAPPHLTLGLGCSTDPEEAADKATREERHVRAALTEAGRAAVLPATRSRLDRLLLRAAQDPAAAAALLGTLVSRRPSDPVVPRAYAFVDLTTADLATVGMHVARAVVV